MSLNKKSWRREQVGGEQIGSGEWGIGKQAIDKEWEIRSRNRKEWEIGNGKQIGVKNSGIKTVKKSLEQKRQISQSVMLRLSS